MGFPHYTKKEIRDLISMLKENPFISLEELSERTGRSEFSLRNKMKQLGFKKGWQRDNEQ